MLPDGPTRQESRRRGATATTAGTVRPRFISSCQHSKCGRKEALGPLGLTVASK